VWDDLDNDGFQDPGEPALANVMVNLFTSSDSLWASAITDTSGLYNFPRHFSGDYYLEFVLPADSGYTAFSDPDLANDAFDSDVIPTTGQTPVFALWGDNLDLDAGMLAPPVVVDALPDTALNEDEVLALENYADLRTVFEDPVEGSDLDFSVDDQSNPALIDPFIDNEVWLSLALTENSYGVDTLIVRATDSGNLFGDDTLVVTIHSVNDPPVLTVGGGIVYTEGNPPTIINNTLTISDVDSDWLTSAAVGIASGFNSAEDILSGQDWGDITVSFEDSILTLDGGTSFYDYQTALRL
ncbi:MAG: hypothetical protein GY869_02625, partial [Planctomycetes bacterium]|nr:hypothetical protein [Planctomycetota bacterium]